LSGLRSFRFIAALSLSLVASATAFAAPPAPKGKGVAGEYDYYMLSLGWTPEDCARQGAKADPARCSGDGRAGFLVRGLWPEFEKGGRPENCGRVPPVPAEMLEAIRPIMAGDEAIQQLWRKHGSCTGLSVDYYFADLRIAFERVKLPDILKQPSSGFSLPAIEAVHRIADLNPELPPESIAGVCEKKQLVEVRLCVNKDLEARTCPPKITANCGENDRLSVR
jgi:ribonuclease T2